ncbi:MAG: PKD domain-containing protein [Sphingobacteriia bacterium]|nr:MAG: PKD domain-containing protein [Sphingobacteriia bacterium]TAG31208.1 MAG: PKD domain-containing protein [Sphingobacteriia bacterium]
MGNLLDQKTEPLSKLVLSRLNDTASLTNHLCMNDHPFTHNIQAYNTFLPNILIKHNYMKNSHFFLSLCLIGTIVISACKKEVDKPAESSSNSIATNPLIGGNAVVFKDTVSVKDGDITIVFSKSNACFPSNEIFSFTATAPSIPSNAKFVWDFGDGKLLTGVTVRNMYIKPATYTVILQIKSETDALLQKASISLKALGQQVSPTAVFSSALSDINYLNNMSFTSRSTVPTGTIVEHLWDWADGTTSTTSNSFMPKNFPLIAEDKTYPVRLIVSANSGCKDTATVNVFVPASYSISGNFTAEQFEACTNEYFIFTPTAIGVPAGAVYTWDFADATGLVTGNPVKKQFTYQNDYDVKMTITLKGKIIYQTHKPVKVYGQNIKPKALMLKNVVSSTSTAEKWAFYSQSNIPHGFLTAYRWEMPFNRIDDNFNTIVEQEYIKAATPSNYTIRFIVTSNTGCKDTALANITIPAK